MSRSLLSVLINESLKDILEKAGYKNNIKTLFICEGVSYYIKQASVEAILEFVVNFYIKA